MDLYGSPRILIVAVKSFEGGGMLLTLLEFRDTTYVTGPANDSDSDERENGVPNAANVSVLDELRL